MKWLLFTVLLASGCGARSTENVRQCQEKCGSLADSCTKRGDVLPDTCIDAYARCVAACSGSTPVPNPAVLQQPTAEKTNNE